MNRRLALLGSVISIALALTGCGVRAMESELLLDSVERERMDSAASDVCSSKDFPAEIVAAIDSTSAGVVEIGSQVETRGDWSSYLPPDPDNYVALCVLDVGGRDLGISGDPDYLVYWVGEGGGTGGMVILTAWSDADA